MSASTPPKSQLLDAARHSVAAACRATRQVQQSIAGAGEITKDDRSPVTVADFAAQAIVADVLRRLLPGDAPREIVGEESAGALRADDQAAIRERVVAAVRGANSDLAEDEVLDAIDACNHDASAESYWTLDPVDGTKGFLRGGQYAISLALIENGSVTIGVMGCPNLSPDLDRDFNKPDPDGLIYFATKGGGAWEVSAAGGEPQRIDVSTLDPAPQVRVCESVESAHTKHDDTARIVEHLGGAGMPARLDSQCKYAVVARGQADAYLRMPTKPGYVEKIWDHAAGCLVATEAGATVSDVEGNPLDFSHGARLEANRGVICGSPAWHGKILEAMEALNLPAPAA